MRKFSPEQLRGSRERAGLTREQLAIAVTRSSKTIASWEAGRCAPRESALVALAAALDVEPAKLVQHVDEVVETAR